MNKALETSQKKVEQRNFEIRKNLLKFDDVINDQRKAIFEQRIEFMTEDDVSDVIQDMRHELVEEVVARNIPAKAYSDQWRVDDLVEEIEALFGITPPIREWAEEEGIADEEIRERLTDAVDKAYADKVATAGAQLFRRIEKQFLLQTIDAQWREHLQQLDHLRSVVHLRGYGQRDPLNEFKTEAFALFERLLSDLRASVTRTLMNLRIQLEPPPEPKMPERTIESHADPRTGRNEMQPDAPPPVGGATSRVAAGFDPNNPATWGRVPRNAACPCGSGKKFKHCHGQVAARV
jgi:preprotein translocase subunit SecA